MITDQADIELIEKFISGKLNHDELVDFETRLEEDHEFARKFRLRKAFPSLFNAKGNDLIMQVIKKEDEKEEIPEIRAGEDNPRSFRPAYIIWPALILIMAVALVWFFFLRPKPGVDMVAGQTKTPVKTTLPLKQEVKARPSVQPAATVNASNQSTAVEKPAVQSATSEVAAPVKPRQEPVKPSGIHGVIELISPVDNVVVTRGEDIVFKWKMTTDSFTNFYLIGEANNKLAWWRGIKPGIRELTIPAVNFKAGKFYWYVGSREFKRTLIIME